MNPTQLQQLFQQAVGFHQKGNLPEAERLYLQILAVQPLSFPPNHLLGIIRAQQGRNPEALELIGTALKANPNVADAHSNYAMALQNLGRFDEAIASYDRALVLQPDHAGVHFNRANSLRALKRYEEALAGYDKALALAPGDAMALYNRANTLRDLERFEEALANYDRALTIQPDFAMALANRGNTLKDLKRFAEALANLDRALAITPRDARAHYNRGNILQDLKRFDEAMASYDKAMAIDPDFALAQCARGQLFLLTGRFEPGWRLFEWRNRFAEPASFQEYPQAMWTGSEALNGKALFIHHEDGLGDTIQFSRYARLAEARGARVILSTQAALVRLFQQFSPTIEIVSSAALPRDFDFHIPLLSMPLACKTAPDSIPADGPYLRAEAARAAQWKDRIGAHGFKVGIAWQGNKKFAVDVGRSLPLSQFEGLSKIGNVRLISLQKNTGVEQLRDLPPGMRVETLGEDFDTGPDAFIDTAAVMENLDLVITSDSAIVHLAGALGRPAWVALKFVPEWRWLLDRADSPWYPSLRLFRQSAHGDWTNVFAEMETQLIKLVQSR